jgi:hypothetical protein
MSDASNKDEKAALEAKVEKFRQRSAAREAEIRGALMSGVFTTIFWSTNTKT